MTLTSNCPSTMNDVAVIATCQHTLRKNAQTGDIVILYSSTEHCERNHRPADQRNHVVFIGIIGSTMRLSEYLGNIKDSGQREDQTGYFKQTRQTNANGGTLIVDDWESNTGAIYHNIINQHDTEGIKRIKATISGRQALIFSMYAFYGAPRSIPALLERFPPNPTCGPVFYPRKNPPTPPEQFAQGLAFALMAVGAGMLCNRGRHNNAHPMPAYFPSQTEELMSAVMPSWAQTEGKRRRGNQREVSLDDVLTKGQKKRARQKAAKRRKRDSTLPRSPEGSVTAEECATYDRDAQEFLRHHTRAADDHGIPPPPT